MIIGINTTKGAIFLAQIDSVQKPYEVTKVMRVQFQINQAGDLSDLLNNMSTILGEAKDDTSAIALLKCSSGQYSASIEAIKAEAIVELSAHQIGIPIVIVTPQSLRGALTCEGGEKWQNKSKEMLNPRGIHKFWSQGANGAACAAYKVAKE